MTESTGERDFFISFNKADAAWATWIAWVLEDGGYEVVFQHWDMGPGSNFIVEMHRAVTRTRQTVLVLSDAALQSDYVTAEWAAALAADPSGRQRKLIPVRVKPLTLPLGLLGQVVYVDLVELGAEDARNALLGALLKRRKRHEVPPFPKEFPGKKNGGDLCRRLRALTRKSGTQSAAADTVDRRELARSLEELAVPYFNILLEALEVPTGVVPQMPALQDERVRALLDWSEGDGAAPSVLRALVAEVRDTVAAATPLDQRTPDPLARNAVDSCDAELADLEELGRAYVAVKQWPKAFFTFRTLVDLAAERDIRAYARGLRYLGKVHLEYREYANAERSLKQSLAVWDRYLERDPRAQEEAEITRGLLEELERRSAAAAARQEGDGPAAATQ
jgi:hypothetical protein